MGRWRVVAVPFLLIAFPLSLELGGRWGEHMSFTDAQVLLPQLDGDFTSMIGTVEPKRSLAAQRMYVAAFFDLHLRGVPTTVFDRAAHPDVRLIP